MAEAYIGEIRLFAGNFAPRGWAFCNGQLLLIQYNTALFSLLGVNYGGDGQRTFAVPDFRGRVPVHQGQAPGALSVFVGEKGGTETEKLTVAHLPAHNHLVGASTAAPVSSAAAAISLTDPGTAYVPATTAGKVRAYATTPANTAMSADAIGSAGTGGAHNNMAPFLALSFIIATEGVFPSHN